MKKHKHPKVKAPAKPLYPREWDKHHPDPAISHYLWLRRIQNYRPQTAYNIAYKDMG